MISIQNPCPEPWDKMHPQQSGRFCDTCCKVVVDFSDCSTQEIENYFSLNTDRKTCGRFRLSQVSNANPVPPKTFRKPSRIVRFLAGLLLVFGPALFSSCGDEEGHLAGDVCYVPTDSAKAAMKQDSANKAHFVDSSAEAEQHKPSMLSPQDSAAVADSLSKKKDRVRDFD